MHLYNVQWRSVPNEDQELVAKLESKDAVALRERQRVKSGMGAAVVGLVGVVIGGLVSGGATFVMARRQEQRKARMAARLLEDELRGYARKVRSWLDAAETPGDTRMSTPPPPAPRVRLATAQRQSRRRIMRGGITLNVRASGTLAFHSHPITLTASARANGHTIAAVRTMLLRPGHVRLLLIPNRRTAHFLSSSRVRALTAVITIRGCAGKQVRRLTITLTR
jgi:hypothetical protein